MQKYKKHEQWKYDSQKEHYNTSILECECEESNEAPEKEFKRM